MNKTCIPVRQGPKMWDMSLDFMGYFISDSCCLLKMKVVVSCKKDNNNDGKVAKN